MVIRQHMRLVTVLSIFSILFLGQIINAQESTVNYFFTACESSVVVELDGTMSSSLDVYVQIFSQPNASGDALTGLTRTNVSGGTYDVTRVINFSGGQIAATGQLISMRVVLAPIGSPDNVLYEDIVDDFQDGCGATGADAVQLTGTSAGTGVGVDPRTGETVNVAPGEVIISSGIYRPDGGILNEVFAVEQEAVVQIGARLSDRIEEIRYRTNNVGLIFAECNDYPLADPGTIFDTDTVRVYWSWFASEAELVFDHIRNANYTVTVEGRPFTNINVGPVVRLDDGNYWVFYTADFPPRGWRPGNYSVGFFLNWRNPISDGFEEFGPGTENESFSTNCDFRITPNPWGVETEAFNPGIPLQPTSN